MPSLLESALAGTTSAMDDKELKKDQYQRLLFQGERIRAGFKSVQDALLFTDSRVIFEDVEGRSREYLSIPYSQVAAFSVRKGGMFSLPELRIWVSGLPDPVEYKDQEQRIHQVVALLAAATSS